MRIPHIPFLSIIFCYYLWIHHSVDIISVSGQIVDDQQHSLLKLKSSLKFKHEKSSKLVSWNSSIDCCEWRGVTCDEEGHVIGLDLSEESINGGFDNSSSIFNLQHLQILNLAANNFGSEIPSGFNKLKKLTYLNLSYAGFMGKVPVDISSLTRLVTLDISSISFLYDKPLKLEKIDLQMLFQNLTRIKKLYMDGVSVTAQGNEWCNALLHLVSLQELSMSNCNLSGPLDPSLTRLENLSIIRLDQNNLSSSVPETFADFPNLTALHLSSCGLTGTFPENIFQVATLSDIDLSFNYDLYVSLPEFPQHGSLQTLNVSHTRFSGALPASISNLRQLSILDVSNCNFNGTLPSFTVLSDVGTYLSSIIFLSLSNNSLSGSIPQSLCNSPNLLVLDVSYNHLNGIIPECLTKSETLAVLNLQHNKFNGNIPDKFPVSCALRTLDLNSNLLMGPIPKSLANCSSLEVLDLGNNLVDDEFPYFLNTISTLRVMVLRGNKFHGHIECSDTNSTWHMLQVVDLAFNKFSGSLPLKCFKTWKAMMLEDEHDGSKLDRIGSVVLTFGGVYYQDFVKLTSKGLQLEFFEVLNLFTYVDFSSNNFQGTIPAELMNLARLVVLNLSHNALAGPIPSSMGNLISLEALDLSCNYLEGEIPSQLESLTYLSYLDLSFNHLVGKIPLDGQFLTFDPSSFAGNVELCGPPLIKNCSDGASMSPHERAHTIDWNIISAECGFDFGLALVIFPLLFWKRWRQWYWRRVNCILCRIFPQLNVEYETRGGQSYEVLRWMH